MATRISVASGDFTANSTWLTCDATAELDIETSSTNVTTANHDTQSFTPGAVTASGIALKISAIITPTGTLTVTLRNSTAGSDVDAVTINCADLPTGARGWFVFKFATPVLLLTATNYLVRITRSVTDAGNNRITLPRDGTSSNVSRQLITTLNASAVDQAIAPASGDKIILAGEYTGAGTSNSFVVTLDNTATTSFGPTVSGGPPQGITINSKCDLRIEGNAATDYYLKYKGIMQVNAGGRLLLSVDTATTGTLSDATNKGLTGRITHTTNATPISCECTAHGLATGDIIHNYGVLGNTAANGLHKVTVVDANNFTLDSSVGNGEHLYSGIPTGLWFCPIACTDTAHGLVTGDLILLTGVEGNIGANGAWFITKFDDDTFLLDGSMGTGAYTSGGSWVKQENLDATSTMVLEFDSVANVDTGLEINDYGVVCAFGMSKTVKTTVLESTVIGSDTNSVGAIVDTLTTGVTWKEGAKFDTGWAAEGVKTFTINGSTFTISAVGSDTSITATGSIGTNTGATFAYTGTSKPTVLKVEDTTGWVAGDEIVVASATSRAVDSEKVVIASVDSATQITATTAFTAYHSGLNDANGDVRSEVINLTRNIKIRGISTTLQGYVQKVAAQAKLACKYTEFTQLGSNTTNKRGVGLTSVTNAAGYNLQFCSLHSFMVSSSQPISDLVTSSHCCPIVNNCVFWIPPTATTPTTVISITRKSGSWLFSNNVIIAAHASSSFALLSTDDVGGVIINNTLVGLGGTNSGQAISLREGSNPIIVAELGIITGNVAHSGGSAANANPVFDFSALRKIGVIGDGSYNQRVWRFAGSASAFRLPFGGQVVMTGFEFFGVRGQGMAGSAIIENLKANNGVNNVLQSSSAVGSANSNCVVRNSSISLTTEITSVVGSSTNSSDFVNMIFDNVAFAGTFIGGVDANQYGPGTVIISINHNQVAGAFRVWKFPGVTDSFAAMQDDQVVFLGASPSLRIRPNHATFKLQSNEINIPVANGTTITPSFRVRKSNAYNGRQPRLLLLANSSIGVVNDTVLTVSTTSNGSSGGDTGDADLAAWDTLTATTQAFTADGVARLIIDCDGTAGWINVDDFSCNNVQDTRGTKFWGQDFLGPMITPYNSSSGGGYNIVRRGGTIMKM